MSNGGYSHVAYSDESRFNIGRFRSIGVLTGSVSSVPKLRRLAADIIRVGSLSEFKWHKLKKARERFVALKLIDLAIKAACSGYIRIDVLVWDMQDSRHLLRNRDDTANLNRMYYHLLRNVLRLRWPNDSIWMLHPDEHSSMDWKTLSEILDIVAYRLDRKPSDMKAEEKKYVLRLKQQFGIHEIREVQSHDEPLCQISDLFAGIGAYSYNSFGRYSAWQSQNDPQLTFDFDRPEPIVLTNSERERFLVLNKLSQICKGRSLGVGLRSSGGLKTYDPFNPINFWKYIPQSDHDKAPTRITADA